MNEETTDTVKADGGPGRISEPLLEKMKEEIDRIVEDAKRDLWTKRVEAEDNRLAQWSGQSSDGRKHEDDLGAPPTPFEGATDLRIRLGDMLGNEDVMLLVVAALRAQVLFRGVEASDAQRAGNNSIVLRWVLRNELGIKWIEELIKLAQFTVNDTPALGLMKVYWNEEKALRMERLDTDGLMRLYMENVSRQLQEMGMASDAQALLAQAQQAAEGFGAALEDPAMTDEMLSAFLLEFFPDIRPKRAKTAIRELRQKGKAEFPVPYQRVNGPCVKARRMMENFWLPTNTEDFQTVRMWFESEWLSEARLREREVSMGYDPAWVGEVLKKQEAKAAFPDYVRDTNGRIVTRSSEFYHGLYNIVTCYFEAVNDDGVLGKYYVTIHTEVDFPAHERRLIDYAHGKYPGHLVRREVLTDRVMDSRGTAELAGPHQGIQKLLADSFGDHAQIAGVPPIITHGRQREGALRIRPLAELQAKRDGDYKWLQPPAYPATLDNMLKELRRQVNEYFGRPDADVSPDLVNLHRMFKTLWWLSNVREILMQLWALVQQYMPDEKLQRITNSEGYTVARSREEIQGNYDVDLMFDPRDLDPENLSQTAQTVKDLLLAMDRDKTINTSPVVSALLWRLAPDLAEAGLRSVSAANQAELKDEEQQYLAIRAGREPDLPDDGSLNYELRKSYYDQLVAVNPAVFSDLAEDKTMILQSRLQRLDVLAQQYGANVQIGQQGGKTAVQAGLGTEMQGPGAQAGRGAIGAEMAPTE